MRVETEQSHVGFVDTDVHLLEDVPELLGRQFGTDRIRAGLHMSGEVDLQATRKFDAVVGFEEIGDSSLARLRIHPNDRVVRATDVAGVDR